ncbi:MAG TPA: cation diffusion facilitator family transporter [Dehalococcoidia bacterium]|nr:cation diffusion facilitator family transporter [Dehalococcoidia bacterium]
MSGSLRRVVWDDLASRAAALSIILNAVLLVMKIVVAMISGSVAVLSDAIDNSEDLIAISITFASVRLSTQPPDEGHPYGHGGAETIAAWLQGTLIGIGGALILWRSLHRLFNPPDHIHEEIALVSMLIAAVANFALVQYTGRVARTTGSPAIAAEAKHLWTNVVQAATIFVGLGLVAITGNVVFDSLVALGLAGFLFWTAGHIFWSAGADILSASLPLDEVAELERAILDGEEAISVHELRTRRAGQNKLIDFHVALPGSMRLDESHAVTDRIQARIEKLWPGTIVTIHVDPAEVHEDATL